MNGKYINRGYAFDFFCRKIFNDSICRALAEGCTGPLLKDNMLPPESDMEQIYHIACENLVRDVEFAISQHPGTLHLDWWQWIH